MSRTELKNRTIAFTVTETEWQKIDARVRATGLPKGRYFMETFLGQDIKIHLGRYDLERFAVELRETRKIVLAAIREDDNEELSRCAVRLDEMGRLLKKLKSKIT